MKKIFTTLFAILLIASLSVTAFADTGIVNVIAGMNDTQPAAAGRESGMELIRQTGDQDEIVKPNYSGTIKKRITGGTDHEKPFYSRWQNPADRRFITDRLFRIAVWLRGSGVL